MKYLNTNQIFYELNLIKTPQNTFPFSFKGSFSIKLTKICHKNRGEASASIPFNWLSLRIIICLDQIIFVNLEKILQEITVSFLLVGLLPVFFNCHFIAPWPFLDQCWGHSLTNPMLIIAFDSWFNLEVTMSLVVKFGPKAWPSA